MAAIICPKCRNQFQGPSGTRIKCPHCGTLLKTPMSVEQKRQQQAKSMKNGKIIFAALLSVFLIIIGLNIADQFIITFDEYVAEKVELSSDRDYWVEEMEKAKSTVDWAEEDIPYETDPELRAGVEEYRDKAQLEYNAAKRMIEYTDEELKKLKERYESGIWYKLFG